MSRKLLVLTFLVVLLAVTTLPAGAVTGNYVKDFEHPYVGMLVFYDASGQFIWRCSGSLLSPTVVLTAGHCADIQGGAVSARIYLQQGAGTNYDPVTQVDPVSGYPEYCAAGTEGVSCASSHTLYNYGYPAGFPEQKDVGLVILDQPLTVSEYGQLPTAGFLDKLATKRGKQSVTFTISGYGVSYTNPVKTLSFRERLMANDKLTNLRSHLTDGYNVQLSSAKGIGGGGCFGDSGGPSFYGGSTSNLIVGVNSFVMNENCAGTNFAYRIDQQAVLDWISTYLPD
jgi:secreted trypsin-like serine protease